MTKNIVKALGFIGGATKDVAKEGFKLAKDSLMIAVPATTLAAAYMVSKLVSPGGVKANVNDIIINAKEQDLLAGSLRDLERLKIRKALESKAKPHDQFV